MTVLLTTTTVPTSHPTDGATRNKRDRTNKNGKTTLTKVVLTCTVRRRPDTTPRNVGSRLRTLEIKEEGKMNADAEHILRTKKYSASRVPRRCISPVLMLMKRLKSVQRDPVSQTTNVSHVHYSGNQRPGIPCSTLATWVSRVLSQS